VPHHDDFERGLADTVEWYASHRDWWEPHKQATEAAYAAKGQ
jgi:dTDP-glucose 4,6-dehydratase